MSDWGYCAGISFDSLGYGVYNYDNKFYKYEGQWKNGLKHGKFYHASTTWISGWI